jgi:polyferredoxin
MAGAPSKILRPRLVIYSAIIVALASLLSILLLTRSPADVTLLRNLGNPFVISRDGMVENTMRVKITNRTDQSKEYRISAVNAPDVKVSMNSEKLIIAPGASATESLLIIAPPNRFSMGHLNINLQISDQGELRVNRDCLLLGPLSSPAAAGSTGGEHDRR